MDSNNYKSWNYEEIKKLIEIWSEFESQLKGSVRNKEVYVKMELKLKEIGVLKDWNQIKTKIKNLKADYKKFSPGVTGSSPSDWMWFNDVHKILHNRHYYNQSLAPIRETEIESENSNSQEVEENESEVSYPSTPLSSLSSSSESRNSATRKRKRVDQLVEEKEDMKNTFKTLLEKFEKSEEEYREDQKAIKEQMINIGSNINELVNLMKQQIQNQMFIPNNYNQTYHNM